MEDHTPIEQEATSAQAIADEVKSFYTVDFKKLLLAIFKDPFNGVMEPLRNPSNKHFRNSIIIIASLFVLYIAGSFLMMGSLRSHVGFKEYFGIGLAPVLITLLISALSFGIKSIFGKADFSNELLTGALCGIPLAAIMVFAILANLLGIGNSTGALMRNPLGGSLLFSTVMLYFLLMMINVFHQSLRAANLKEPLAWYLSPAAIMLACFLAFRIVGGMMF